MLLELNVKDIALIKKAGVEFAEGLNILTGETGAGKSIVMGSVSLALGKKAQPDLIREGAQEAYIELLLDVPDALSEKLSELSVPPSEEGTLIISRRISQTRSQSRINDETVTLSKLREVTELFIDLYGQHEYQNLLDPKKHLNILDDASRKETGALREAVKQAFLSYRSAVRALEGFQLDEAARTREMELAAFEIGEIESAALREGEEEELAALYRKMSHGKVIAEHLARAHGLLSENGVSAALSELSEAAGYDEGLNSLRDQLFDAESILSGALREIRDYADGMDLDEARFHEVEERLNLIRDLMAKYGKTAAEVESYRKQKEERLSELTDYEVHKKRAEEARDQAFLTLTERSMELRKARKQAGQALCQAVSRELMELGFQSVSFALDFKEREPSENGMDEVCFTAALNPGERLRPLWEAASGGELSRVMLALKTVLAETDQTPTLIFDEIDTGISGRTAQKVAERLKLISKRHQVICITHLPQIAAMADAHFVIEKEEEAGRNVTEIRRLSEEESLRELGRLLGGARITEAVMENAAEMRRLAREGV